MKQTMVIKHQKGAVLIISLIVLLVLTILAISIMNISSIAEKSTSNQRDKEISFQAAQAALTDAEAWLKTQITPPKSEAVCTPDPCNVFVLNTLSSYQAQSLSWWQTYGTPYSGTIQETKTQPHFVIEEYNFIPYDLSPQSRSSGRGYYYYRISAQGTGSTDNANSVVQSIYSTQFN